MKCINRMMNKIFSLFFLALKDKSCIGMKKNLPTAATNFELPHFDVRSCCKSG